MDTLENMTCEVCRVGAPQATEKEIGEFLTHLPDWKLVDNDGLKRIQRSFKFKDFAQALEFTNKVGALAEQEGHHPSILTRWGNVRVTFWTHKIGGLHRNDFIMAARTDKLYIP
jgi:4a-hydroxytetrahydrobiopterin dehydratase